MTDFSVRLVFHNLAEVRVGANCQKKKKKSNAVALQTNPHREYASLRS